MVMMDCDGSDGLLQKVVIWLLFGGGRFPKNVSRNFSEWGRVLTFWDIFSDVGGGVRIVAYVEYVVIEDYNIKSHVQFINH